MRKFGEAKWSSLKETERQRRITQLKIQERSLRRQGKFDALEKLFNALAVAENGRKKRRPLLAAIST